MSVAIFALFMLTLGILGLRNIANWFPALKGEAAKGIGKQVLAHVVKSLR
ncbi:MAG: hypothetical protein QM770_07520 [Tepidisphaeraceae bacterium]